MSNYKDFKEFYETKLLPDLKLLDADRKKVDKRVMLIFIITLVVIIIEAKLIQSGIGYWKGVIQFITGIAGFILISLTSKKYRLDFKTKIIKKIIGFVDDNLTYIPEGSVSMDEFVKSAIFQKSCNSFRASLKTK